MPGLNDSRRWAAERSMMMLNTTNAAVMDQRELIALAKAVKTLAHKKPDVFECLECGRRFRSVKAAERALQQGCSCGGYDIDLVVPA
jgi:predicted transcriptional regulator